MKYLSILFVVFHLLTASTAWAVEDTDTQGSLEHKFSIGAVGMVMPKYEGANTYTFRPFPLLDYSNQYFFVSTTQGAGVNLLRTPTVHAGPLLNYRFGRKENDSHHLDGLGDVKGGVEAGAFFAWQFHERLGLDVKWLHGLGNAKGFTADASLTFNQPLTNDLLFVLEGSVQFADSDYNEAYFGITHTQSRRSGYESYSPGSGIKHVSLKPALRYTFLEHYNVGIFYEYKKLTGPAADSPLVKAGSANQSMTGVSLTWTY